MQVDPLKLPPDISLTPQAAGFKQHNHLVEVADVHAGHAQGAGQVFKVEISRDHRGFRHPGLRLG